jgi:hypothetical protein
MDCDWRKAGWDTNTFTKNFYTPEAFENSVRAALQAADEYVWIYTEQPRWWTDKGTSTNLPEPYDRAVRRSRAGLAKE